MGLVKLVKSSITSDSVLEIEKIALDIALENPNFSYETILSEIRTQTKYEDEEITLNEHLLLKKVSNIISKGNLADLQFYKSVYVDENLSDLVSKKTLKKADKNSKRVSGYVIDSEVLKFNAKIRQELAFPKINYKNPSNVSELMLNNYWALSSNILQTIGDDDLLRVAFNDLSKLYSDRELNDFKTTKNLYNLFVSEINNKTINNLNFLSEIALAKFQNTDESYSYANVNPLISVLAEKYLASIKHPEIKRLINFQESRIELKVLQLLDSAYDMIVSKPEFLANVDMFIKSESAQDILKIKEQLSSFEGYRHDILRNLNKSKTKFKKLSNINFSNSSIKKDLLNQKEVLFDLRKKAISIHDYKLDDSIRGLFSVIDKHLKQYNYSLNLKKEEYILNIKKIEDFSKGLNFDVKLSNITRSYEIVTHGLKSIMDVDILDPEFNELKPEFEILLSKVSDFKVKVDLHKEKISELTTDSFFKIKSSLEKIVSYDTNDYKIIKNAFKDLLYLESFYKLSNKNTSQVKAQIQVADHKKDIYMYKLDLTNLNLKVIDYNSQLCSLKDISLNKKLRLYSNVVNEWLPGLARLRLKKIDEFKILYDELDSNFNELENKVDLLENSLQEEVQSTYLNFKAEILEKKVFDSKEVSFIRDSITKYKVFIREASKYITLNTQTFNEFFAKMGSICIAADDYSVINLKLETINNTIKSSSISSNSINDLKKSASLYNRLNKDFSRLEVYLKFEELEPLYELVESNKINSELELSSMKFDLEMNLLDKVETFESEINSYEGKTITEYNKLTSLKNKLLFIKEVNQSFDGKISLDELVLNCDDKIKNYESKVEHIETIKSDLELMQKTPTNISILLNKNVFLNKVRNFYFNNLKSLNEYKQKLSEFELEEGTKPTYLYSIRVVEVLDQKLSSIKGLVQSKLIEQVNLINTVTKLNHFTLDYFKKLSSFSSLNKNLKDVNKDWNLDMAQMSMLEDYDSKIKNMPSLLIQNANVVYEKESNLESSNNLLKDKKRYLNANANLLRTIEVYSFFKDVKLKPAKKLCETYQNSLEQLNKLSVFNDQLKLRTGKEYLTKMNEQIVDLVDKIHTTPNLAGLDSFLSSLNIDLKLISDNHVLIEQSNLRYSDVENNYNLYKQGISNMVNSLYVELNRANNSEIKQITSKTKQRSEIRDDYRNLKVLYYPLTSDFSNRKELKFEIKIHELVSESLTRAINMIKADNYLNKMIPSLNSKV